VRRGIHTPNKKGLLNYEGQRVLNVGKENSL